MAFMHISDPTAIPSRTLDASIERSLADLRAGRLSEARETFNQLETKYRRMAAEWIGR